MEIDHPNLFIEINDTNYIFVAGTYDENQNLKVIEKKMKPFDLVRANEIFLTNTINILQWVSVYKNKNYNNVIISDIYEKLQLLIKSSSDESLLEH